MKNTYNEVVNDYDSEPVKYCPKCYSLKIGCIDGVENSDYCMKCGCSEIEETSIEEWENMYEERYGKKFIERKRNPAVSEIYRKTLTELKQDLYDDPQRMDVIKQIYPGFPKYLTPVDTVLLFFDKLCKDSKINEFRDILISRTIVHKK